ncbi:hypothetical protein FB451DRAFT_1434172 [Mycena latifolia]|nr:hypothetical protein FB451DRAFT_1434172 [Mycena latifolia]
MPPTDGATSAEGSRLRRPPAVVLRAPTLESVAIVCGAEERSDVFSDDYDEHRPWALQILPEAPAPPPPAPRKRPPAPRSSGCGARVHGAVCIMRRSRCWFGWGAGLASTVVPLDAGYFPAAVAEALDLKDGNGGRAACGGNPLGTRQSYCSLHAPSSAGRDGFVFLTSAVSSASAPSSSRDASPPTASSPVQETRPDWTRDPLEFETVIINSSAPSHVALTSTAYSPVAPEGYIPFIPPSPVPPPLPSSSTAPAPPPAPPARPLRRRTLRRPASVERYFGLDDASSGASPPPRWDAPPSPPPGDAGGGTMSMSAYLRTLSAPHPAAQQARDDDMPPLLPVPVDDDEDDFAPVHALLPPDTAPAWAPLSRTVTRGWFPARVDAVPRAAPARIADADADVGVDEDGRRAAPPPPRAPAPRVRALERHLDELGARVAALDVAAADMRAHIEALRGGASPPPEAAPVSVEATMPTSDAPAREPRDEVAELRRADVALAWQPERAVPWPAPSSPPAPAPASPISDTSTLVPPLAALQARLAALATPSPTAGAPGVLVLGGIVREQTELLARVGALVAAIRAQESAGEGGGSGSGVVERVAAAIALHERIRAAASPAEPPARTGTAAEDDKRPPRRRVFFER